MCCTVSVSIPQNLQVGSPSNRPIVRRCPFTGACPERIATAVFSWCLPNLSRASALFLHGLPMKSLPCLQPGVSFQVRKCWWLVQFLIASLAKHLGIQRAGSGPSISMADARLARHLYRTSGGLFVCATSMCRHLPMQRHVVSYGVRNVTLCPCAQCHTVSVWRNVILCRCVRNVTLCYCERNVALCHCVCVCVCVCVYNVTLCHCVWALELETNSLRHIPHLSNADNRGLIKYLPLRRNSTV